MTDENNNVILDDEVLDLLFERRFGQFNNRQQLGSYVGLTPSHFQSGPMSRDQGISKAGNPKARTVMIELAWLWLRHQPNSPLSIWLEAAVPHEECAGDDPRP